MYETEWKAALPELLGEVCERQTDLLQNLAGQPRGVPMCATCASWDDEDKCPQGYCVKNADYRYCFETCGLHTEKGT